MPAKDFGTKYLCFKCNTKFYDLKKPDPICPKCGADQRDSAATKPAGEGRRSRLAAVPKIVEPIETPAAEKDGDELEIDDIDEDEDEDDDV
jgi:hypothetical protein